MQLCKFLEAAQQGVPGMPSRWVFAAASVWTGGRELRSRTQRQPSSTHNHFAPSLQSQVQSHTCMPALPARRCLPATASAASPACSESWCRCWSRQVVLQEACLHMSLCTAACVNSSGLAPILVPKLCCLAVQAMEAVELLQPSYVTLKEVPQVLSTRLPLTDPQPRLLAHQRQRQQIHDGAAYTAAAATGAEGTEEDGLDPTVEAEGQLGADEGVVGDEDAECGPAGTNGEGRCRHNSLSIVGKAAL